MASIGIVTCLTGPHAESGLEDASELAGIVESCGSAPFILPHCETQEAIQGICEEIDGLILAGGQDVHLRCYDDAALPGQRETDERRDWFELRLVRRALALEMPVLGFCRGCQVLNVAAGGSLYLDLAGETRSSLAHGDDRATPDERPDDWRPHPVDIAPGSLLHRLVGRERLLVSSYHHQAVKEVAPGFRAVAWARDGLTEAIEGTEQRFALGVQWPNQVLAFRGREYRSIFEGFLGEADAYRAWKRSPTIIAAGER